ncbi:MAG: cytochrome C [Chlorobiaceae bacterium]
MKTFTVYPPFIILLALLVGGGAFAGEQSSLEKGRQLFNSPALAGATSGRSCASCHPKGSGLENAWKNPNLATRVNSCIAGPLKGLKLNVNSVEMQSLIMYIRSLKQ